MRGNQRATNHVLQFANVAGPRHSLKTFQRVGVNLRLRVANQLCAISVHEIVHQAGYVLPALTKRARSLTPRRSGSGALRWRTRARFFWMRLAT